MAINWHQMATPGKTKEISGEKLIKSYEINNLKTKRQLKWQKNLTSSTSASMTSTATKDQKAKAVIFTNQPQTKVKTGSTLL
jgi:hypothetical protein